MRTALNIAIILSVALVIGLIMRAQRGAEDQLATNSSSTPTVKNIGGNDVDAGDAAPAEPVEGWLNSFTLIERNGESITSESLKGQPYIASFFFSTCPSICKLQNEKLQQLQTEFKGLPIRFVAITVDPETDTPEKLQEYAKRYKADAKQWLFLTGDLTYIRRVGAEMFTVAVDKQVHTERFILVDSEGKILHYYTWTDPGQFKKLKDDIQAILEGLDGNI